MRIQPAGAGGHARHLHSHAWVALVALIMAAWWGGSKPGFVFEKYTLIKPANKKDSETESLKEISNMKRLRKPWRIQKRGHTLGGEEAERKRRRCRSTISNEVAQTVGKFMVVIKSLMPGTHGSNEAKE